MKLLKHEMKVVKRALERLHRTVTNNEIPEEGTIEVVLTLKRL